MSAIIGTKKTMEAAQGTFISSTYWTERVGPTAALATIQKLQVRKVPLHLKRIGKMIGDGWQKMARKHGLIISVLKPEALVTFSFNYGARTQAIKTLFTQEMLKRGFLATASVYVSYAHQPAHVRKYLKAVDEVFRIIKNAIETRKVEKLLEGPISHSGFKRLT